MQMRTILIGALALIFGLSAAAGVYLLKSSPAGQAKVEMVSVVVAASDIVRGQLLNSDVLVTHAWPKESVPEGAITDPRQIEDRTAMFPIIKGDLMLEGKLAPKGSGRGLAAMDDQTGGGSTITLLQNIEILAVDQQIDIPKESTKAKTESRDLRSVTVMVTPEEAERLDLGQNKGTLRLTLRNPADKTKGLVDPVTMAELQSNSGERNEKRFIEALVPSAPSLPTLIPIPQPPKKIVLQIRTMRGTRSGITNIPTTEETSNDDTPAPAPTPSKGFST
jgi:pilus assembly protein CpaB